MKRTSVALAGLCLTGTVLGCTDGRLPAPVEQERSGVVGGKLSNPGDDAVVGINVGNANACTATLIAPDVVLTALHCVTEGDTTESVTCNPDGTLATNSPGGNIGALVDPTRISVADGVMSSASGVHGKAIFGTNSPVVCRDDIAVVVLDGVVKIGDAPLATLRFNRTTKKGDLVRVVGYGETNVSMDPGRHERDNIPILGVGSPNAAVPGDTGVAPRTIVVGESDCHGDSGGPLFSEDTGAAVGVTSLLASGSCQGPNARDVFTQVAPYEDLIRKALSSVGEEPLVEVPPDTGSGGEGGVTGQAGEPSTAGAPGEAGASHESTGGSGGRTGGTGAVGGGSGAVAGSGVGATGGDTAMGDDTSEAGAQSEGSGSRRDPSCTCRTGRTGAGTLWPLLGLSFAGLSFLRRRRR